MKITHNYRSSAPQLPSLLQKVVSGEARRTLAKPLPLERDAARTQATPVSVAIPKMVQDNSRPNNGAVLSPPTPELAQG